MNYFPIITENGNLNFSQIANLRCPLKSPKNPKSNILKTETE